VLGLGFGLLQTFNRSDPTPALLAINQAEPTASTVTAGLVTGASLVQNPASPTASSVDGRREIQVSAKVIEPSYTVQAGDTLGRIAVQFGTTPERIQALNNLADPRTLRIGTRLIIPPPL
jgi:LysM repeat protein